MARADICEILGRAELLAHEIDSFVPTTPKSVQFRADMAGLLVVSMAASYEASVKDTLINFAARHHYQFMMFTQSHFEKLNSRISISDLYRYARTFDHNVHSKFGDLIKKKQKRIINVTGKDIQKSYSQILSWRHDFAHAGVRNTTVEEALAEHRLAKRVLYAFDDAFC